MPEAFAWEHAQAFLERIERLNLHGLHFQHVELCERRAWMYMHKVNFAQWYSRVQTGSVLHDTSYQRDHSVRGLFGLAPDRIEWDECIVYENKGTGGAMEASSNQTAFYALMLSISTGKQWRAYTHVLSSRRRREVVLDAARLQKLWDASVRLEQLSEQEAVPAAKKISLCETCSLAAFCGFD
ncbi:MAG TPA: Dna2/Cas4 domain-containing protein [Candidatus Thiothrix moscowensis]|uniref:Dna2/Cas4 domain-containing protein n=1 Tax=Thiothrix sp. UBA2016 TaxID=1947695 RepID=UPI0025F1BE94|nr:Dna2/Cas4 domain-containing protein [Thiothrix sp. UBA2016]HRJ53078.1 Dna2/Cas4 domain-containing protein [Candidatus Thiothrix moscowensis]HRJ93069.1 Dna2/Cas4 domain-containing protein [Candidatus Thiothrix moscowensis]